jgi:hypothetical protein
MLRKVCGTANCSILLMSLVAFGQIDSSAVHSRTQTITELSKQLRGTASRNCSTTFKLRTN